MSYRMFIIFGHFTIMYMYFWGISTHRLCGVQYMFTPENQFVYPFLLHLFPTTWSVRLSVSVCPFLNFSRFHLLQKHLANFNQTWHPWVKGIQVYSF